MQSLTYVTDPTQMRLQASFEMFASLSVGRQLGWHNNEVSFYQNRCMIYATYAEITGHNNAAEAVAAH